ncbi:hypothetical protein PUN28_005366 [Cardiocondyla obscurior]|uniref:Secreted protein n=1 Tax=Cardiocondyla obscurior TaxID=286306 RepID=A0AAW2GG52_9HYME
MNCFLGLEVRQVLGTLVSIAIVACCTDTEEDDEVDEVEEQPEEVDDGNEAGAVKDDAREADVLARLFPSDIRRSSSSRTSSSSASSAKSSSVSVTKSSHRSSGRSGLASGPRSCSTTSISDSHRRSLARFERRRKSHRSREDDVASDTCPGPVD